VAGDTTIRSKIHGLWESFFPSTIYFVVFVAIALFSFGFEHAAELSRAGQFDDYASSKLYLLLKDLELLKLVPIAAVFAFAFLVYVFDRLAMMVGNALPPFPVWHGSTALYVEKPYLLALWSLLPDESNVATLDSHARRIIDQAKLDEKPLPSNSFTWLQERQNKAGSLRRNCCVRPAFYLGACSPNLYFNPGPTGANSSCHRDSPASAEGCYVRSEPDESL
jgi:hypothetical protein